MTSETTPQSSGGSLSGIPSIIAEGVPLVQILAFWILVSTPALAWVALVGASGLFRTILLFVPVFFFVVGVGNLFLYVLVRADALSQ